MPYPFVNLVFEGGGVKGIAYVGALKVLEQKKILQNIKRVGGTSAGAINAVLLGLGYSVYEMERILSTLDFKKMLDDSFGIVRDCDRLIHQYGWYKGDYFREWIANLIRQQTGNSEATFYELSQKTGAFREMYFIGANLSTGFAEVFSAEHTPRWCIADAVRISMSIPLFFAAKYSPRGDCYVDGGLLDNYPVKLFDRQKYLVSPKACRIPEYYSAHNQTLDVLEERTGREINPYVYNPETLGFRLDTAKEIAVFRDQAEPPTEKVSDFFDYAHCLIKAILNSQDSGHLHSDDWQRTIYIDTLGVNTTDFGISSDKKRDLITSGENCTTKYFSWYDDPSEKPVNRP